MIASTLVTIVSLVNLLVISAMLFLIWKEIRGSRMSRLSEKEPFGSAGNRILERIQKLESLKGDFKPAAEEATASAPHAPVNRISLAIEKINRGVPADQIGRELGYSRSEMGILLASARHGKAAKENVLNPL